MSLFSTGFTDYVDFTGWEKLFNFTKIKTDPLELILTFSVLVIVITAAYLYSYFYDKKRGVAYKTTTREITLGAVALALAFVLSFVKLFSLTNAGSITLASVLPIALFCYVYGFRKSLPVTFIFAVLNFIQKPYVVSPWSVLLDYFIPYLALSLIGLFAVKDAPNETKPLKTHWKFFVGIAVYFGVRYVSHFLSGVLYWNEAYDFMGFNGVQTGFNAVAYSLVYNAVYLIPDTVIAAVAALVVLRSRTINHVLFEFYYKSSDDDSAVSVNPDKDNAEKSFDRSNHVKSDN